MEIESKNLSSRVHVHHTTARQVISRQGMVQNDCKCAKMKNAGAKRAKRMFFVVRDRSFFTR